MFAHAPVSLATVLWQNAAETAYAEAKKMAAAARDTYEADIRIKVSSA